VREVADGRREGVIVEMVSVEKRESARFGARAGAGGGGDG